MIKRSQVLFAMVFAVAYVCTEPQAKAQTIISFDAPNAGTSAYQGTEAVGINSSGTIAGLVTDSNNVGRGFVRTPDGKFTEFTLPGIGFFISAFNDLGFVVGSYLDSNNTYHGFLCDRDGKIVSFDAAGAGTGNYTGTFGYNLNDVGVVMGSYLDANSVAHGFLRTPDGGITSFDDPESGDTGPYMGTWAYSINDFGVIAGASTDSMYGSHGFVRAPDGNITTFSFPGSPEAPYSNAFINDLGLVAGNFNSQTGDVGTGFERMPDGKITTFEAPGAGAGNGEGTFVVGMNIWGAVTGNMNPASDVQYNFVRDADGNTSVFAVPGQILSPGCACSSGSGINASGVAVGWWLDANYVYHSFIRFPR